MDGEALRDLAFALGLAPAGVYLADWHGRRLYLHDGAPHWEPQTTLAQADAVFRQLRVRGWTTAHSWYTQLGHGLISVRNMRAHFEQFYGRPQDESEALGMLRCACLAAAHEAPPQHGGRQGGGDEG